MIAFANFNPTARDIVKAFCVGQITPRQGNYGHCLVGALAFTDSDWREEANDFVGSSRAGFMGGLEAAWEGYVCDPMGFPIGREHNLEVALGFEVGQECVRLLGHYRQQA